MIIADEGYYWLQIGIENENFWITAIFDKDKNFIQYYIDVTLENHVVNEEEPYFLDLFLDIVLLNTGRIFLLDKDELDEALEEKVITKNQYELAKEIANKILESLPNKKEELDKLTRKYLEKLIKKIENTKKG